MKKKQKIIQVTSGYPPRIGGMENVAKEISERLAKKGHDVEVFTSDAGCGKCRLKSTDNLKIHYLDSFEFAHTPIIPSLFFNFLKIPKDSIMHIHTAQAFVPEIVYLVSKFRNFPYIIHFHADVGPSGKMGFLLPFYKKIFLQKILNSASKIIVPTKDYVNLVNKKYSISKTKIYVVPPGVDLKNFKLLSIKLHNPIRLLFVGRLSKEKNVPLLIRSLKKTTVKNHYNIKLHIVGSGEEKNKINLLIKRLKLDDKVVSHGELRGKRLYEIYSNSDIFILTSAYESFGLVLIEAMASGLPIIASNIPAVRNVIKNNYNGLLVKPTPEEIAKAIQKLLNSSELRGRLIENGLEEVKKYNWDKIVSKFEWVYKEVIYDNNKK